MLISIVYLSLSLMTPAGSVADWWEVHSAIAPPTATIYSVEFAKEAWGLPELDFSEPFQLRVFLMSPPPQDWLKGRKPRELGLLAGETLTHLIITTIQDNNPQQMLYLAFKRYF